MRDENLMVTFFVLYLFCVFITIIDYSSPYRVQLGVRKDTNSAHIVESEEEDRQYRLGESGQQACSHPIYCNSTYLYIFQMSRIFNDSKTFVDSTLKQDLDQTLLQLQTLLSRTPSMPVKEVYEQLFYPPGGDLEEGVMDAVDQSKKMPIRGLPQLLHLWAEDLHRTWKRLTRRVSKNVSDSKSAISSIIPVSRPFIVPGGRFNEFYYWDTYWIVKGLLASDLLEMVEGTLENFYGLLDRFGFIPNGNRVYYSNRSQPPMLTQMVQAYFDRRLIDTIIKRALPYLVKEYKFWMTERIVSSSQLSDGEDDDGFRLNVYRVNAPYPRPESFVEDLMHARQLNHSEVNRFYSNVAAGAESGWDFSSRWLRGTSYDLTSIETESFIPVDLNSIMHLNENTIAYFYRMLNCLEAEREMVVCSKQVTLDNACDASTKGKWFKLTADIDLEKHFSDNHRDLADYFCDCARKRRAMIHKYLWNTNDRMWFDWDLKEGRHKHHQTDEKSKEADYLSILFPLWTRAYDKNLISVEDIEHVVLHLNKTLMGPYPAGVPTSAIDSTQQWDFPNAWPPLQWITVEALLSMPFKVLPDGTNRKYNEIGYTIAQSVVERWLETNYCGWNATANHLSKRSITDYYQRSSLDLYKRAQVDSNTRPKGMFEKYNVEHVGRPGGGGEYVVQDGFGWTNGVILDWLLRFREGQLDAPFVLKEPSRCPDNNPSVDVGNPLNGPPGGKGTIVIVLWIFGIVAVLSVLYRRYGNSWEIGYRARSLRQDLFTRLTQMMGRARGRGNGEYENLDEVFLAEDDDDLQDLTDEDAAASARRAKGKDRWSANKPYSGTVYELEDIKLDNVN